MQKKEIVAKIAEKTDLKLKDINAVLDGFVSVVEDAFNSGERVELRGFGNFIKKTRKARKGCNFKTGKVIDVPAKDVLTFKQSSLFNKK